MKIVLITCQLKLVVEGYGSRAPVAEVGVKWICLGRDPDEDIITRKPSKSWKALLALCAVSLILIGAWKCSISLL